MSTPTPTPQEAREAADRMEEQAHIHEGRAVAALADEYAPEGTADRHLAEAIPYRLAAQALREKADRDEHACPKCKGTGIWIYGDSLAWRHDPEAAAFQGSTPGVCDECWGTGDAHRKGVDLRALTERTVASGRNRQRYLGALSMRDAVLRLLSTAPVLATTEAKAGALRDVIAGLVRSLPLPPIVEEDEAVAQAQADLGLVFGPWHQLSSDTPVRHAVAVDGCPYIVGECEDGNWFFGPSGDTGLRATESEAIEAARAHDEKRRGAK